MDEALKLAQSKRWANFVVQSGLIIDIKPLNRKVDYGESQTVDIDIIMTGKPKSMQDKLKVILAVLREMELETGAVNGIDFFDRLSSEFDMDRKETARLVQQLIREGMVYVPRTGYLKKT